MSILSTPDSCGDRSTVESRRGPGGERHTLSNSKECRIIGGPLIYELTVKSQGLVRKVGYSSTEFTVDPIITYLVKVVSVL